MKKRGFTLIELLVVISIISILSSVVISSLKAARDKAVAISVNTAAESYFNAALSYQFDYQSFPTGGGTGYYECVADYDDDHCGFFNTYNENITIQNIFGPLLSTLNPPPSVFVYTLSPMIGPFEGPVYGSGWPMPPSVPNCQEPAPSGRCAASVLIWYVPDTGAKCGIAGAGSTVGVPGNRECRIYFLDNSDYEFWP